MKGDIQDFVGGLNLFVSRERLPELSETL